MNVFITGGSKGIGKSIVNDLIENSSIDTIYIGSTNCHSLIKHDKIQSIELDYLNDDWIEVVKSKLSKISIDILINNSGYLYNSSIESCDPDELDKMIAINYRGPFKLVRTLLSNLKLNGGAHIVNIGSMGGFQGSSKFPGLAGYSSSKAALANLSECWAEEFKEFGIKSNCLSLGAVNTEMLKEAFPGYEAPVQSEQISARIVDFAINFSEVVNGKVIPFSESTP